MNGLIRRGARIDLPMAAALGAHRRCPSAACGRQHGGPPFGTYFGSGFCHAEIVRFLLDAGEDPNRYNPWEAIPTRHRCTKLPGEGTMK
jgi:hypothetical protein